MKVNDRIRKLRERNDISREAFAKKIGVTYAALSKYETGSRAPDYDTLIKIADYFDVTTDYLLGRLESAPAIHQDEVKNIELSLGVEEYFQQKSKDSRINEEEYRKKLKDLGISEEDYSDLSSYQQEVLDWAINEDALFFKNKSHNVLDMIDRLEIAYEVNKAIEKREKNNKTK